VTLGRLLRRYRRQRGLTQAALAKKARVRQALISDLETGKQRDTLTQTMERLARALDVTLEDLLGKNRRRDRRDRPGTASSLTAQPLFPATIRPVKGRHYV
jgi:transcriptional regulator with XRE-family HTH domain